MSLLDKLDRRFSRHGVRDVTLGLILCQVLVYIVSFTRADALEILVLTPERVLAGEVWRLITFLCVPPQTHPIFAFFFWYLFYLMGTALENSWGAFRYNVYLLIGYAATVAVAFVTPDVPSTNAFLEGSVFLAFAFLYPDFELFLFFLLRVKIKWLALITWVVYFLALTAGEWTMRLAILASIANFLLFFGGEILLRMRSRQRRMSWDAGRRAARDKPFHRCLVCGITDKTHPDTDFRYCAECEGTCGYCPEHLYDHPHVTKGHKAAKP